MKKVNTEILNYYAACNLTGCYYLLNNAVLYYTRSKNVILLEPFRRFKCSYAFYAKWINEKSEIVSKNTYIIPSPAPLNKLKKRDFSKIAKKLKKWKPVFADMIEIWDIREYAGLGELYNDTLYPYAWCIERIKPKRIGCLG